MATKKKAPKVQAPLTPAEIALGRVMKYRKDFVGYFRNELNAQPTNQQIEALEFFQDLIWAKVKAGLKQRMTEREKDLSKKIGVSIHSGKGTGKDYFAAGFIILMLDLWTPFKGISTASNKAQLEDVLSTQIKRILSKA